MKTAKQWISVLVLLVLIEEVNGQQIRKLGNRLSELNRSSAAAERKAAQELNTLFYDAQPTLYGSKGKLIRTGEQMPVRLVTDVASLPLLNIADPLFAGVKLLIVRIEDPADMRMLLRLADLRGFLKLENICFQCSFKICPDQPGDSACETDKLSRMIEQQGDVRVNISYTSTIDN